MASDSRFSLRWRLEEVATKGGNGTLLTRGNFVSVSDGDWKRSRRSIPCGLDASDVPVSVSDGDWKRSRPILQECRTSCCTARFSLRWRLEEVATLTPQRWCWRRSKSFSLRWRLEEVATVRVNLRSNGSVMASVSVSDGDWKRSRPPPRSSKRPRGSRTSFQSPMEIGRGRDRLPRHSDVGRGTASFSLRWRLEEVATQNRVYRGDAFGPGSFQSPMEIGRGRDCATA